MEFLRSKNSSETPNLTRLRGLFWTAMVATTSALKGQFRRAASCQTNLTSWHSRSCHPIVLKAPLPLPFHQAKEVRKVEARAKFRESRAKRKRKLLRQRASTEWPKLRNRLVEGTTGPSSPILSILWKKKSIISRSSVWWETSWQWSQPRKSEKVTEEVPPQIAIRKNRRLK